MSHKTNRQKAQIKELTNKLKNVNNIWLKSHNTLTEIKRELRDILGTQENIYKKDMRDFKDIENLLKEKIMNHIKEKAYFKINRFTSDKDRNLEIFKVSFNLIELINVFLLDIPYLKEYISYLEVCDE
jgi:outer membrane translocation and assembly module TamA